MKNKTLGILIIIFIMIGILGYFLFFKTNKNDIEKNVITLSVGEEVNINSIIQLENNKPAKWESENSYIATVTNEGIVKGIGEGETWIDLINNNGSIGSKYKIVVENIEIERITLEENEISLKVGEKKQLEVKTVPENAVNKGFNYLSSDDTIAIVDDDGIVEAISSGDVEIIITDKEKKIKTICRVIVEMPINKLTIIENDVVISIGEVKQLNALVEPVVEGNNIEWASSDTSIVEIDENGIITGKAKGQAIITASYLNGILEDTIVVTVNNHGHTVTFDGVGEVLYKDGDKLGVLPTLTKQNYTLLGWFTAKTGGRQVTSNTIVTSDMTLYPQWKSTYVLPNDSSKTNGYIVSKTYNSSTLKYKVLSDNSGNRYFSLIWVQNANKQLNCANSNYTKTTKVNHFNNEINSKGYQKKGMIGTNGGFSIGERDNIPVLATSGVLRVNEKYVTTASGQSVVYGTLTVNRDNKLVYKTSSNPSEMKAWLESQGARNTWGITHFKTSDWVNSSSKDYEHRTSICQVDDNNFVLYVGYSSSIDDYMKELHDKFGCMITVNLDGGGSCGMYYKNSSMSSIGAVYQYKRPSEQTYRANADVLYFVEQ